MSTWPTNPYLDSFLRSDEGQNYLSKYGCLETWRQRHLLDDAMTEIITNDAVPETSLFLVVNKPRAMGWTTFKPHHSVVRADPVKTEDPWDF